MKKPLIILSLINLPVLALMCAREVRSYRESANVRTADIHFPLQDILGLFCLEIGVVNIGIGLLLMLISKAYSSYRNYGMAALIVAAVLFLSSFKLCTLK